MLLSLWLCLRCLYVFLTNWIPRVHGNVCARVALSYAWPVRHIIMHRYTIFHHLLPRHTIINMKMFATHAWKANTYTHTLILSYPNIFTSTQMARFYCFTLSEIYALIHMWFLSLHSYCCHWFRSDSTTRKCTRSIAATRRCIWKWCWCWSSHWSSLKFCSCSGRNVNIVPIRWSHYSVCGWYRSRSVAIINGGVL